MHLAEWLFHKKQKDPNYTHKYFAKKLNMHWTQFSRILNGRVVPDAKTALAIEEATNGQVSGWELQMRALEAKKKRKKKAKKEDKQDE